MLGYPRLRGAIDASVSLVSLVFLLALVPLFVAPATARAQYIYDIRFDGTLEWRKHLGSIGGTFNWTTAQTVGTGWSGFKFVFPGDDGVIYAIQNDGTLVWRKHSGNRDGSSIWSDPQTVGSGWQNFVNVFSGGDGIIYAIQADGTLLWYRHLGQGTGTNSWAGPNVVGLGWDVFTKVFAGQGGAIYGILPNGDLMWYRHLGRETGTSTWNGPVGVGTSWQNFQTVFTSADGVIYGIKSDGTLQWYKHLGYLDGSATWLGASQVGTGWFFDRVFAGVAPIEGYCWPLSAAPGQTISFKVASPSAYSIRFVRFQRSGAQNQSIALTSPFGTLGSLPATPDSAWQNGCGWAQSFTFTVPLNWASGIYAAECQDPTDHPSWIVFVVKPSPNSLGDFAVLANTNTWNSYNTWGGHSKYTSTPAQALSYLRPNPSSAPIDGGGVNHLTRAELWVDDWLSTTGYWFDSYTDIDFHLGIPNLQQYKALILHTHPEYWTPEMMDHIQTYLAGGGTVLYMAGNGLFEEVLLSSDGSLQTLFPGGQYPWRDPSAFRNLSLPRPEREVLGVAFLYDCWMTFAPFQVLRANHHLFAGTGVVNGDPIGTNGVNGGGASGWEMDTSIPGTASNGVIVSSWLGDDRGVAPSGLELLARGTNACGYGGDMTYYRTGNGGFVFSAGSLSFGGSLVVDSALQQIVRNALFEAYYRVTAIGNESSERNRFALGRNEPNPFQSETEIKYSLASRGRTRLSVFDVQGREVAQLVDRVDSPGAHTVRWNGLGRNGDPAAAGVYFYRLEATGAAAPSSPRNGAETVHLTGRMVLLR
jgi:N,N-dimethylformamidase beta subunit-like protein/tachylectin